VPQALHAEAKNMGRMLVERSTARWSTRSPEVQVNCETSFGALRAAAEFTPDHGSISMHTHGGMQTPFSALSTAGLPVSVLRLPQS